MIQFDGKIFISATESEIEKASENLPAKIQMEGYLRESFIEEKANIEFMFQALSEQKYFNYEEIINSKCPQKWTNFKTNISHSCTTCFSSIDFDKIPENFNSVNVYLKKKRDNISVDDFKIIFKKEITLKELFCYSWEIGGHFSNILLGTLARTSTGWKFYPNFKLIT